MDSHTRIPPKNGLYICITMDYMNYTATSKYYVVVSRSTHCTSCLCEGPAMRVNVMNRILDCSALQSSLGYWWPGSAPRCHLFSPEDQKSTTTHRHHPQPNHPKPKTKENSRQNQANRVFLFKRNRGILLWLCEIQLLPWQAWVFKLPE